ncbi:MAG: hypothetical protein ABIO58_06680, partial [Luteimonas sp.]
MRAAATGRARFEHAHLASGLLQREAAGQADHAATDDEHIRWTFFHRSKNSPLDRPERQASPTDTRTTIQKANG